LLAGGHMVQVQEPHPLLQVPHRLLQALQVPQVLHNRLLHPHSASSIHVPHPQFVCLLGLHSETCAAPAQARGPPAQALATVSSALAWPGLCPCHCLATARCPCQCLVPIQV